jgi:putative hemolysin
MSQNIAQKIAQKIVAPVQDEGGDSALIVRLADSEREVDAAQALRYRVFYENMGAQPSAEARNLERDFDVFDPICDHLLIIDRAAGAGALKVVGTYRLMRAGRAQAALGFYSDAEFDLSRLHNYPGEHLELGRSCVDPDYRSRSVLQLLWKGISDYLIANDITLMFGCASFPGTRLDEMTHALSMLHHNHLASDAWRPIARANRYVPMNLLTPDRIDTRRALREIPPLIKGYLRIGGVIGDGAVIDPEFNTVDVCLLVESHLVPGRYVRHYTNAAMEQYA